VNGLQTSGDGGAGGLDAAGDVTKADGAYQGSSGVDTGVAPEASSGNDTGTTGDVGVTETAPVDGCVATGPESCTNGIDDDCNGLTDCADPACTTQGYTCVAPIAGQPYNGWDFVALNATAQSTCPASLTQKNVDVDPTNLTAPAACGCSCAPGTPPSCETGNVSWTHGPNNQCNAGGTTNSPANGGACNMTPVAVDSFVLAAQPPPTGGTCTASASVTQPPTGATQGEVCGGEKAFGAGCTGGQVCGLVPPGFTACVHHGGANMGCPAGPYAATNSVGTIDDTRGCGACTCGAPTATCTTGTWSFFGTTGCTGPVGITLQTNDQCNPTGDPSPGPTYASNRFTSNPAGGSIACAAPATPPSTGNVTLTGADTVCCQ